MRYFLLVLLATLGGIAYAQVPKDGNDYYGDVAFMYGDIQQVTVLEEICSEQFPSTRDQNRAAVEDWRGRNQKLIQEIDVLFADALLAMSNEGPARHSALVVHFKKSHESAKVKLKEMLVGGGMDIFRKQCEYYPSYLAGPEMNLEISREKVLRSIRQGPYLHAEPVVITPTTKNIRQAFCYISAKKTIEKIGSKQFPSTDGEKLYGELKMTILIRQDGGLGGIAVVETSGNIELDRAAERIVSTSAPFNGCIVRNPAILAPAWEISYRFKFYKEGDFKVAPVDGR